MENQPSSSGHFGNVGKEQTEDTEGSDTIPQKDGLKFIESFKNYLWKRVFCISIVLLTVFIAGLVVGCLVGYYVEHSHEGNDYSKMVNRTSTMCLEDVQIRFADHLGNNPILDCIDYSRNITVQKCAKLCRKGGHIYECRSHGGKKITIISVENVIRCNAGNPKHYDIEIENDKFCFCAPFDFKSLKIALLGTNEG